MSPEIWSYVGAAPVTSTPGAANVAASSRWGLMPRVLAGAAQRDLSVELFGTRLPTPLLLSPVGVIACASPRVTAI